MEKYLNDIDIPVFICLDTLEAEGLEKQMIEIYNNLNFEVIKKEIRFTEKQKEILLANKQIKRFWQIKELEGIGITTYEKLFVYCKELAEGSRLKQISLFD